MRPSFLHCYLLRLPCFVTRIQKGQCTEYNIDVGYEAHAMPMIRPLSRNK